MKNIITLLCLIFVNSAVDGVYENKVNLEINYSLLPDDDKMIGFLWKDFKIPLGEKIEKVKVSFLQLKII